MEKKYFFISITMLLWILIGTFFKLLNLKHVSQTSTTRNFMPALSDKFMKEKIEIRSH